ncbi:MAG: hypothetical protein QOE45_1406 [Frankiaceae bacterium]|jgi:hypothetical protein|nr:hypothetical protein [Frankiaceae bacterium]
MTVSTVAPRHGVAQVTALLDLPEVRALIAGLDETRWTGRPGYPVRTMVGVLLAKSVYALPTWTRTLRLLGEHDALRDAVGGVVPSDDATYRFTAKMREHRHLLDAALDAVVRAVKDANPDYGIDVALDGSDMAAYSNGHRTLFKNGPVREKFADADASWGHRSAVGTRKGGGYFGHKLHAMVCTRTELPIAWTTRTAKDAEKNEVEGLFDIAARRGVEPATATLDKGYDAQPIYDLLLARHVRPVIALVGTLRVQRGEHKPPTCQHGTWTFAGADDKRQATQWRCPSRACKPASVWIKYDRLHPPIPHGTDRWKAIYRGRTSVERCFGRLKNDAGLTPLRVRGSDRVSLHTDLTILTTLAAALARARALSVAA